MRSMKPSKINRVKNPDGTYSITEEEKKFLDSAKAKNTELYKEQLIYQRDRAIKQSNLQIKQKERAIKFKQGQINNNESLENHSEFKGGLKPLFYLENDIENIRFEIETLKDSIVKLKEEQEKDVRERKKDV